MNGAPFYVNSATEVVLDPQTRPTVQNTLLQELRKCEELVQRDYRYAHLVAGSSKMPMTMIWAVRNQDELVNDTDLATFKDLAWTEFVKKRFLPSVSESSVCASAVSMLEIVRGMNLQRRRFQIMGLHEQVEASEIQLVLHLCQAEIIRSDDYRKTANRFRRADRIHEAFALAVGATVCATAPLTLGAATARYERDLQYEYRKNAIGLLVYVLKKNAGPLEEGLDEDYVARIARIIVVSPSTSCPRVGPAMDDDSHDKKDDDRYGPLSNAIALAQHAAEKAERNARDANARMEEYAAANDHDLALGKETLQAEMHRLETRTRADVNAIQQHELALEARLAEQVRVLRLELEAFRADQNGHMDLAAAELREIGNRHQADVMGIMMGIIGSGRQQDGTAPSVDLMRQQLTHDMAAVARGEVNTHLPGMVRSAVDTALHAMELRLQAVETRNVIPAAPTTFVLPSATADASEIAAIRQKVTDLKSQTDAALLNVAHQMATIGEQIVAQGDGLDRVLAIIGDQRVLPPGATVCGMIQGNNDRLNGRIDAIDGQHAALVASIATNKQLAADGLKELQDQFTQMNRVYNAFRSNLADDQAEETIRVNDSIAALTTRLDDFDKTLISFDQNLPTRITTSVQAETAQIRQTLATQYDVEIQQMHDEIKRALDSITANPASAADYSAFTRLPVPGDMRFDDQGGDMRMAGPG